VATTLDSTYPHVVLVNPAGVAELEDLREKLRAAVETKWLPYHHEVKVENEAVLFCLRTRTRQTCLKRIADRTTSLAAASN